MASAGSSYISCSRRIVTVVPVGSIPTNLGGGTNEDIALLVERSSVLVLGGDVAFSAYEDVGSATQTVRISARGYIALLLRSPAGVAKITSLTAPSGF
jgi:hypothetical protein